MIQFGPKFHVGHGFGVILTLMLTCATSVPGIADEQSQDRPAAVFAGTADWLTLADGSPLRDEPGASQGLEDLKLLPDSSESQDDEQAADEKSQGERRVV